MYIGYPTSFLPSHSFRISNKFVPIGDKLLHDSPLFPVGLLPEALEYLNTNRIHTTVRQVIVPTLNDSEENIIKLKEIILDYPCIDKTELLPFRKICQTKYDSMNLPFPLAHIPEPNSAEMAKLNEILIK